jgi:hypothetical protein
MRRRKEPLMEPRAYGRDRREWRFEAWTRSSPERVYDLLENLGNHLEWAGRRQWWNFRLLALDSPPGPARVGTEFSSVGRIPLTGPRWHNRNVVTEADRPRVFEITTEGRIPWPRGAAGEGTFINRYEIDAAGDATRVVYTMRQLRFRNPPWGMRYPLLRELTYRFWIPIWSRRGFSQLLRMAEERERAHLLMHPTTMPSASRRPGEDAM